MSKVSSVIENVSNLESNETTINLSFLAFLEISWPFSPYIIMVQISQISFCFSSRHLLSKDSIKRPFTNFHTSNESLFGEKSEAIFNYLD